MLIIKLDTVTHCHELEWKDQFAVFRVKVTVMASMVKLWLYALSFELLILLQPNLVQWPALDCHLKRLDCFIVFKVMVTAKVQNFNECSSGWYLLNCWICRTKLGMVMHHQWSECHAKRLVCYFQGQSHNKGSYSQLWLFSPYLLKWTELNCNQI